jgi:hypothetical protein
MNKGPVGSWVIVTGPYQSYDWQLELQAVLVAMGIDSITSLIFVQVGILKRFQ